MYLSAYFEPLVFWHLAFAQPLPSKKKNHYIIILYNLYISMLSDGEFRPKRDKSSHYDLLGRW